MKKIILIVILLFTIVATAQDNNRYRFFMSLELGVQNFFNRSTISMIDYNQDNFIFSKYNCILGLDNLKEIFALEISASGGEIKYDKNLRETVSVLNIGLLHEKKFFCKENFFLEYITGVGLLTSSEFITYNSKDLDAFYRLGGYVKYGLGFGFDVNNFTIGLKGDIINGYLQSKSLPSIINTYQIPKNRNISSYTTSLFLKIRL